VLNRQLGYSARRSRPTTSAVSSPPVSIRTAAHENRTSLPPIVKAIVTAAIVEMALLNCTHGITVQTAKAKSSSWVPYEFGRAKQRWLVSTQVASWFDNGMYAASTSDYLKLGVCAIAEKEVVCRLGDERARYPCPKHPPSWSGVRPAKLPN
jgi:hypothetical protein